MTVSYYEVFLHTPELGLWMEAERMLHPVINQIGVDTQNEVVKKNSVLTTNRTETFKGS
jgi:hypothetical protein